MEAEEDQEEKSSSLGKIKLIKAKVDNALMMAEDQETVALCDTIEPQL